MGDDAQSSFCWRSGDIRILDREMGRETERLRVPNGARPASQQISPISRKSWKLILFDDQPRRYDAVAVDQSNRTTRDGDFPVEPTAGCSPWGSQWLITTPEGLFDGSADAMEWVAWRVEDSNELVPVGDFFNDYYEPGLLSEIMAGANPKPTVDVASVLQIPGLRAMVHDKNNPPPVSLLKIGDGAYACFEQKPTALNPVNVDPVRCKYGLRLPLFRRSGRIDCGFEQAK